MTVTRDRWKPREGYEVVESVPDGLTWRPGPSKSSVRVVLYSIGGYYMLVRMLETGDVTYYKRTGVDETKSPAEAIDAEPAKPDQVRYRTGQFCWFIDNVGKWYCCEVVKREPGQIILRSVTGFDAERTKAWPYTETLGFSSASTLFKRLRPLKARQR